MSSPIRRLAAGIAASGILMSPLSQAEAAECGRYLPTLADCQNPVTECALQAREKARTDPNATCNTLIQQAANSLPARAPQRTVVVPPTRDVNNTSLTPDAATKLAYIQNEDPNTRTMSGLSGFYLGGVHRAQTYLPSSGLYASLLESQRQQQRAAWNANGNVIDSCNEYVYEKYYDYSVFEDAFVKLGNNYRAIFNTAYAPAVNGVTPASAIGTRGIVNPVLRGKDGTPFTPNIPFQAGLPKNQFFTVPLPAGDKVSIATGDKDQVTILPGLVTVTLKNLHRNGLSLTGVVFNDSTLKPTIDQGASYYNESWSWHKAMSETNAGLLDEQMYEMDRLQEDFAALLAQRESLAATLAAKLQPKPLPVYTTGGTGPGRFSEQYWRDPVWNPDPTSVIQAARWDLDVLSPMTLPGLAPASLSVASTPSALPPTLPPITPTIPNVPIFDIPVVSLACSGNQIICLLYRLEALDDAIEAALLNAKARGCLSFQRGGGAAACDWSPKRFAQRVTSLYQGKREQQHARCMDYTDDNFAALKSKAMSAGTVYYPPTNYTLSPTMLETYFTRRDLYLKALSTVAGGLLDPVTDKPRLKWESGDSYSMGNDTFGASAEYNVSLSVDNLSKTDACVMSPRVHGFFKASGSAFGHGVSLVQAEATVSDVRADIDLDVLDNTIHLVDEHKDLIAGTYNLVSGAKSASKTFVDVQTHFVIVVVPVTLGAKVAGTVGLNYALDASHKLTRPTPTSCVVSSIGVNGRVEPYASVDAELYAGVDLFIVEAGVKGKLQLVHAGIPLNTVAELSYGANNSQQLGLQLAGRADLKFTFLSGSIAGYAEVGVWPFEKNFEQTLISWDGLHYDLKLFDRDFSVPVADLQELL
ncbi:hypothetical protein CYFUS_005956 [Cystobacter fuscus]|uniref:Uncharacterized protein n=1 Tax=Cystobacter fuscus TaxID=43 RepID=A0A250JAH8_9BACT|nr:hypothetical protein [Cystobacter fuscus]ATB40507.1 hypothetical protein CYFUS_005956 [Cystobacter fuscus]